MLYDTMIQFFVKNHLNHDLCGLKPLAQGEPAQEISRSVSLAQNE